MVRTIGGRVYVRIEFCFQGRARSAGVLLRLLSHFVVEAVEAVAVRCASHNAFDPFESKVCAPTDRRMFSIYHLLVDFGT